MIRLPAVLLEMMNASATASVTGRPSIRAARYTSPTRRSASSDSASPRCAPNRRASAQSRACFLSNSFHVAALSARSS